MIYENLNDITKLIAKTCQKANKDPKNIVLVNVSKTKPISILEEGYEAGMRIFGENKVQELCDKYEQFKKDDIQWHMIGHLQRNKVKYIVEKVALIHSVDSFRLAETISKEAKKKNVMAHILIQVNAAQEDSKFGLETEEVMDLVRAIHQLEHLKIEGLMTIAPFVDNPEENRPIFKYLKPYTNFLLT